MAKQPKKREVARVPHPGPPSGSLVHLTSTAGAHPSPWRPINAQLRALELVAGDLALANDRRRLVTLARISDRTWARWCSDSAFSAWWNAALVKLCKMQAGPALLRLHELCMAAGTSEVARVKGIDTFLRHAGIERTPNAEGALFAMLEKWKSARAEGEVGETVKPATVSEAPGSSDAGSDNSHYVKLPVHDGETACDLDNPPAEAMVCGPDSIESAARQGQRDLLAANAPDEEGTGVPGDGTGDNEERPWDRLSHTVGPGGKEGEDEEGVGGSESQTAAPQSRETHAHDETELDHVLARLNQRLDDV